MPQLLLDLGGVPVREDAVGRHAAVVLREVRALGRRLAGAGEPGLRVDDDAPSRSPALASGSSASSAAVG